MIDQYLDKPEVGDMVEFKITGEYGGVITMRGEVIGIAKNGRLKIKPDVSDGKTYFVDADKVFVLSKGES